MLMRLLWAIVAAGALASCNLQSAPAPSPSPIPPAKSAAADLRTHLDLLLSEHVIIVAKESAAAADHSDEYSAYTTLLGANGADLSGVIGRAFGTTAGVHFMNSWNAQNGFLVDYAIGEVTHNDDKAKAASTSLTTAFVPQFVQLVSGISGLPKTPLTELAAAQATEDMAFIDDVAAGNFNAFYPDLHHAYAHASRLGDVLAGQIAVKFPDKFPGDPGNAAVATRVNLNVDLQEHSYLATMATDATLNHRDAERGFALAAISTNDDDMKALVADSRFALAWSVESGALQSYAVSAGGATPTQITGSVVPQLMAVMPAAGGAVTDHENASIRVVDDQRGKSPNVANDDRAAATSMQPLADSLR